MLKIIDLSFRKPDMGQENISPWNTKSLNDFLVFKCPECIFLDSSKQMFVDHACEIHPESIQYLKNICDSSINDVELPWKFKTEQDPLEAIKSEDEDNLESDNLEKYFLEIDSEFSCDQCCQSFFDSQNLIDHVKNFHEKLDNLDNESKVESKKKVICEEVVKDALARSKGKDTEYSQENHPSAVLDEENPESKQDDKKSFTITKTDNKSKYHCNICGKVFDQSSHIKTHVAKVHEGDLTGPIKKINWKTEYLKCQKCAQQFRNYYRLSRHMARTHEDSSNYFKDISEIQTQCDICNEKLSNHQDLLDHLKVEHNPTCCLCLKEVGKNVMEHLATEHQKFEFGCVPCKVFCDSKAHMVNHMEFCDQKFQCPICLHVLKSHDGIKVHLKIHHWDYKKPPATCHICGTTMASKNTLRFHMVRHHSTAKNFECDECGDKFKFKEALKSHKNFKHGGERNFVCDLCGHKFLKSGALKDHYARIHEKQKFKCPTCGKLITSKFQLKVHIQRMHTEVRKFPCDQCQMSYVQKFELEKHKRTVHEGVKKFACETCGKKFVQSGNYYTHLKVVHQGIKDFKCDSCGKGFTRKKYLEKHSETCH